MSKTKSKRILSLVLAVVLALSLAAPISAQAATPEAAQGMKITLQAKENGSDGLTFDIIANTNGKTMENGSYFLIEIDTTVLDLMGEDNKGNVSPAISKAGTTLSEVKKYYIAEMADVAANNNDSYAVEEYLAKKGDALYYELTFGENVVLNSDTVIGTLSLNYASGKDFSAVTKGSVKTPDPAKEQEILGAIKASSVVTYSTSSGMYNYGTIIDNVFYPENDDLVLSDVFEIRWSPLQVQDEPEDTATFQLTVSKDGDGDAEVAVPKDASKNTINFKVTASGSTTEVPDDTQWMIVEADSAANAKKATASSTPLPEGLSFSGTTGQATASLSVTKTDATSAINGEKSYYIVAKSGTGDAAVADALEVTITNAVVSNVEVDPESATIMQGENTLIESVVTYSDDSASEDGSKVEWSVLPAGQGVTVEGGIVTAADDAQAGEYTVTATSTEDSLKSASATVTVTATPITVVSVSVSPKTANIVQGEQTPLTATVTYSSGAPDSAVDWSVSPEGKGITVDADGIVTAAADADKSVQKYTVTATSTKDDSKVDRAEITVTASNDPTVSPQTIADATYGTPVEITISGNNADNKKPITVTSDKAKIENKGNGKYEVTPTALGEVTVTVAQDADSNNRVAGFNKEVALTVSPANLDVIPVSPAEITSGTTPKASDFLQAGEGTDTDKKLVDEGFGNMTFKPGKPAVEADASANPPVAEQAAVPASYQSANGNLKAELYTRGTVTNNTTEPPTTSEATDAQIADAISAGGVAKAVTDGLIIPITSSTEPAVGSNYVAVVSANQLNDAAANVKTSGAVAQTAVPLTVNSKPSSPSGGGVSAFTVTYTVGDNGTTTDKTTESVTANASPKAVPTVTAKEGYKFLGWSLDGKTVVDPTTQKITKNTTFTALYEQTQPTPPETNGNTYTNGYTDRTFRPNNPIKRDEVVTMLARLSKAYDASATYTGSAPDVPADAWYANPVFFGMANGLLTGYQDGTVKPEGLVKRSEFSALICRYMGMEAAQSSSFTDAQGHWANGYIGALADAGIITGYSDGTVKPDNQLTRAEAVTMINRAIKMQAGEDTQMTFQPTDISGHWAEKDILAATNVDLTPYKR